MRPFISMLIIVLMPFMFFSIYGGKNVDLPKDKTVLLSKSNYCNSRFDFCVIYPATVLPNQEVSVNDDGVILKTAEGKAEVNVFGSYNITNWSPQELFEFSINSLVENKKEKVEIYSSTFGEDYYECYFEIGNNNYINRSYFVKDYYISLMIKVPKDEPILYQKLLDEVTVVMGDNS